MADDSTSSAGGPAQEGGGSTRLDEFTRWRATLDSQPEMICRYRPDATITFVNRAYADQYDTRPDDLIGRSVLELLPDESQDWARDHIERLCATGKPIVHENTVHRPDGSVRHYQWSDHVVSAPDGTVLELQAVGRDITERRLAEDALRASEHRLARLFDGAPIGMAVVSADGDLVRVNDALCALLGLDEQALLACSLDDIVADGGVHALARARLADRDTVVQLERRLGAEASAWGLLSISALDDDLDRAGLLVQVVDLTDRKRVEAELAHRAHHDPLTGLPNRAALLASLEDALAEARREGEDIAVLFCDLDGFKLINDTLGHEAGDALLEAVAVRLRDCLRADDTLARFGGDEFVILHRGDAGEKGAVAHAERVIEALGQPIMVSGVEAPVGVTVGIAVAERGAGDSSALIRDADTAMYHAKAEARGTVRVCHDQLRAAVANRFTVEGELRAGLASGQFRLHYQPIVRPSGELAGLEALLRWRHPQRGLLAPDAFLAVAEDSRVIAPIGAWVLEEACKELATLSAAGAVGDDVRMWVNVSGVELGDQGLAQRALAALERVSLPPERLGLEVSERSLPAAGEGVLESLRAHGIALAIDDLGTGTAPLVDLLRAPVDVVKIAQALVAGIGTDDRTRAVLAALFDLARAMEVDVVAEGVETRAQREMLDELGCDLLQGFGIARPGPSCDLRLADRFAPAAALAPGARAEQGMASTPVG